MQPPTSHERGASGENADSERYVTIDVEVSGDLEARWVFDRESGTTGLMLRHLTA